jgi:hypothetical protein
VFERLGVFVLELRAEEGAWVLAGISIIVGLRLKCTCFGGLSGCPVRSKDVASFVQLAQRKAHSRSAPRVKW